jgi:hypothetical protein
VAAAVRGGTSSGSGDGPTPAVSAAAKQQQAAAMKLLTHNFLQCHVKGVKNGYPLKIEAEKTEERDADFDPGVCARAGGEGGGRERGAGVLLVGVGALCEQHHQQQGQQALRERRLPARAHCSVGCASRVRARHAAQTSCAQCSSG